MKLPEAKHLVFADDLQSLPTLSDDSVILTTNAIQAIPRRQRGEKVVLIEELLTATQVKNTDHQLLAMVRNIIGAIDDGEQLEYTTIPSLIEIGKVATVIGQLDKSDSPSLLVHRLGRYPEIVAYLLEQQRIPFDSLWPSWLVRYSYFRREMRLAAQTKWRNSRVRNLLLEPAWVVLMMIKNQFRGLASNLDPKKKLLLVAADRFTLPVYQKLLENSDWQTIIAGKTYPGRKLFTGFSQPSLEQWLSWADIFKLPLHYFQARQRVSSLDEQLEKQAEFEGINFWPLLRKNFRANYSLITAVNRSIQQAADRIFSAHPRCLLCLSNDVTDYNRALLSVASNHKVPSLVIQHGLLLEMNGHNRILADHLAGWGENSVDWYRAEGNPTEKVTITGNPRFDDIPTISQQKNSRERYVLIGTDFVVGFSTEDTYAKNLLLLEHTAEIARSIPDKSLRFYLSNHPGENSAIYDDFFSAHPEIQPVPTRPWHQLLNEASVYISNYSTALIEAIDLNTPAILYTLPFQRQLVEKFKLPLLYQAHDLKTLKNALTTALTTGNPSTLAERNQATTYFLGRRDGHATERAAKYLDSLVK